MSRASRDAALAALGGCAIAGVAKARGAETYGRWPWLAPIAAPPATVAVYASRERLSRSRASAIWASLPLLLWHQTEEWVLPSGFLSWFNRSVWHSHDDEFPVTPRMAFRINVIAGWGVGVLAAPAANRAPWLAAGVLSSHVANAVLHVGRALEERRYNPGLATSLIIGPLGLGGVLSMIRDREARNRGALLGVASGFVISAMLPVSLRRRVRAARS